MIEIKPTLRIAQQISRKHTLISLKILLPSLFLITLLAIIALKLAGVAHPGKTLQLFYEAHRSLIIAAIIFIQVVPINYYAIKQLFHSEFSNFRLRIISKEENP